MTEIEITYRVYDISNLSKVQKDEIKEFLINVYSDNPNYKKSVYTNSDLETCVLMYLGNEMVGHAGITKRTVKVDSKDYLVAGVGDVAIKPELQGKGLGKLLMEKANEVIKSEDYYLGLLFCHPKLDSFYTSAGWTKKENGKIYALRHGQPEDQRLSYILPLKLNQEELNKWNNKDINIGEGSW